MYRIIIGFDTAVNKEDGSNRQRRITLHHSDALSKRWMMQIPALWCGIVNGAEKILLPEGTWIDDEAKIIADIKEKQKTR